ncbi:nuclear transport factor 2 family protein [Microbacterium sp. NPDC056234]|uniref:nuclear transport factor 2 family protein n=1 Tax=Microbacterium sp. NPDC056234 TaxID=3345757 RepID=UPI0035D81CE3
MNDLVNAYIETWNATSGEEKDALLSRHWASEATYTDPMGSVVGHAAIAATIDAVHEQFPGFVFTPVGTVDSHHSQTRFQWGLGPAGEAPMIIGFDVLVTDETGRIHSVLGFLDQVPAA